MADLDQLWQNARSELASISDEEALEAWRLAYLGRRGAVTQVLRGLGELPPEERRKVGSRANELREDLEHALAGRQGDA